MIQMNRKRCAFHECRHEFESQYRDKRYCSNSCKRRNHYLHNLDWHRAYYNANRETLSAYNKRYNQSNGKSIRLRKRFNNLNKRYGITAQQYGLELKKRAGKCDSCRERKGRLNIDHCHKAGHIRGFLCSACNFAAGLLNDSPEKALSLSRYLGKNQLLSI